MHRGDCEIGYFRVFDQKEKTITFEIKTVKMCHQDESGHKWQTDQNKSRYSVRRAKTSIWP